MGSKEVMYPGTLALVKLAIKTFTGQRLVKVRSIVRECPKRALKGHLKWAHRGISSMMVRFALAHKNWLQLMSTQLPSHSVGSGTLNPPFLTQPACF